MENEQWPEIREYLSESGNIPEIVVDYLAVSNILQMCVRGLSNCKIAYFNHIDEDIIESALFRFLGFKGWDFDLDLDPWRVYVMTHGDFISYELRIMSLTNLLNCGIIQATYKLCKKYNTIKEEIEHYD